MREIFDFNFCLLHLFFLALNDEGLGKLSSLGILKEFFEIVLRQFIPCGALRIAAVRHLKNKPGFIHGHKVAGHGVAIGQAKCG